MSFVNHKRRCRPRSIVTWPAGALFVLLACHRTLTAAPALAAASRQDVLIQVLFGDLQNTGDVDTNGDGAPTVADVVADILLLGPANTPTETPTATLTPTPSATATETPVPTPVGLLFNGTIAELVPHGVGDLLMYRITDPLGAITTETTNVISVDAQGGFVLDDLTASGQQTESHQAQSYSDTGGQLLFNGFTDLFFTPHTSTTCSPPLLRLTTPLVAGQMFSTTVQCDVRFVDSGVFIGFVSRTDTFTPKEIVDSVTVPAGTFTSVVHISGTTNQSGQLETDEIYVAPGVGPVLQLATFSGQTYRHELISGTIGGHPVGP